MSSTIISNSSNIQGGEADLPARITKAGSKQTYYTFRLLADRGRVQDAFRSYAYFRWLDDLLDCNLGTKQEKIEFLNRQQVLLDTCYQRHPPGEVSPEEQMLVDLVHNDGEEQSGLKIYLRNMMAVMSFDVERRGRVISEAELSEYTRLLSTAVTDLLFFFIGHEDAPSRVEIRYYAVNGAHVVHMLRDMVEDISAGYFNVPCEYIKAQHISMEDLHSLAFRKWVFERVKLARQYFDVGRKYISQVKSFQCRLAGFAYLTRFEWVLRAIELDGYCLRADYPERKSFKAGLWIGWRTLVSVINLPWVSLQPGAQVALSDQCEHR
jgi:phytoene/squalene synthetase